jgi:tetratricopeptide (TPR) repeat protein
MLRYYLLYLLIFWARGNSFGFEVEDHRGPLNQAPRDTQQVNELISLSADFIGQDLQKAVEYSEKAYELAIQLKFPAGACNALNYNGIAHFYMGDYQQAANSFD